MKSILAASVLFSVLFLGCASYRNFLDLNITMVPVSAGSFIMGSPDSLYEGAELSLPRHKVRLPFFLMSAYEISQLQFSKVMGRNPSKFKRDDNPVTRISWLEAIEFCNQLSRIAGLEPCYYKHNGNWLCDFHRNGFRLPTEAEWEYACRAGTDGKYCSGDSEKDLARVAWYGANSDSTTHSVAVKEPNAWGLYDMHGNVWEMCYDWYDKDYYSDGIEYFPTGPEKGMKRIVRGGSYFSRVENCRSDYRMMHVQDFIYYNIGFRVVRR